MSPGPFDERNGWRLYQYPAFKLVFDRLVAACRDLPDEHPKVKLLARVTQLILDEIPADPSAKCYRLGKTLGPGNGNWFRAKFLGRFRLFFRFDSRAKVIIYCWLNDENTLRQAGSDTDPYAVFASMLRRGDPPANWADLWSAMTGTGQR